MDEQYERYLNLWIAVIEAAIHDALAIHNPTRDQREAYAWVTSDATHPTSFLWACDMLNVCPIALRDAVRHSAQPAYARRTATMAAVR